MPMRPSRTRGQTTRSDSQKGRSHSTSRTGARRAAQLKRTLAERPKDMPVEFPYLGADS